MTTTAAAAANELLQRAATEALAQLRVAREVGDKHIIADCQERMDRILDRLCERGKDS
jgi:hypothetical protein